MADVSSIEIVDGGYYSIKDATARADNDHQAQQLIELSRTVSDEDVDNVLANNNPGGTQRLTLDGLSRFYAGIPHEQTEAYNDGPVQDTVRNLVVGYDSSLADIIPERCGWDELKIRTSELGNSIDSRLDAVEAGDGGGVSYTILTSGQYDSNTGMPTINNPDPNIIYLVPQNSPDNQDGYVEWFYINNGWEKFGRLVNASEITKGILSVGHGGTNADTAAEALQNLGGASATDLSALATRVTALENGGGSGGSSGLTLVGSSTGSVRLKSDGPTVICNMPSIGTKPALVRFTVHMSFAVMNATNIIDTYTSSVEMLTYASDEGVRTHGVSTTCISAWGTATKETITYSVNGSVNLNLSIDSSTALFATYSDMNADAIYRDPSAGNTNSWAVIANKTVYLSDVQVFV